MITLEQLTEMLDMQEQLEIRIDGPNWREKGHDYRLCIHMECAEIIDHMGWKHWKYIDELDWDAIAMELIDVWHFGLAMKLQHNASVHKVAEVMSRNINHHGGVTDRSMIAHTLELSYAAMLHGEFHYPSFIAMMGYTDIDWDDLYRLYVGKNVLNWFRQDHGYKEGLYMKNWAGKEDNEHLFEITKNLGDNFSSEELIKSLSAKYALAGH